MATLFCTFCGNTWEQGPLEIWHCEECTMWAAPLLVKKISDNEIESLWKYLTSFHLHKDARKLLRKGHIGYYESYLYEELYESLDFLVMLFDKVVIPELWKGFNDKDESIARRFLSYYDAGAIIPLDQGGSIPMLRDPKDDFSQRIVKGAHFIDVLQHFESVPSEDIFDFSWARENLVRALTYLDLTNTSLSEISKLLAVKWPQHYFNWWGSFYTVVNFLQAQIITSQILKLPLLLGPLLSRVMQKKLGVKKVSKEATKIRTLKRFTNEMNIHIPKESKSKEIIKLRESKAGEELRSVLEKLSSEAQNKDHVNLSDDLIEEYDRCLKKLWEQARKFGNIASAVLTGCFSTAGALIGGPVGAVVGGIGGTAVSLGTRNAFEHLYKKTHKNWAYYFYKWKNR